MSTSQTVQEHAAFPALKRQLNLAKKAKISINVDQHFECKVYSTGSAITGQVSISDIAHETPFSHLDVYLVGTSTVKTDFIRGAAPNITPQTFLKIRMPADCEGRLPSSRLLEPGHIYSIPFHFVMPSQLTVDSCNHGCRNTAIREKHLQLPPTMGQWEDNDQAPTTAQIQYAIRAVLVTESATAEKSATSIQALHKIKFMPLVPEQAPLDVTEKDQRYQLSKTKAVRPSLLSKTGGKLTLTASQPSPVVLTPDAHFASKSCIKVRLDLDLKSAAGKMALPEFKSATGKLEAETHFSLGPINRLPNQGPKTTELGNPSLSYSSAHKLRLEPPAEPVAWTPADGDDRKLTTCLEIPFRLRKGNKQLYLPTFHSCRISRTYTIHLSLNMTSVAGSVSLDIPLQLAVSANDGDDHLSDGILSPDGVLSPNESIASVGDEEGDGYFVQLHGLPPTYNYSNPADQ